MGQEIASTDPPRQRKRQRKPAAAPEPARFVVRSPGYIAEGKLSLIHI